MTQFYRHFRSGNCQKYIKPTLKAKFVVMLFQECEIFPVCLLPVFWGIFNAIYFSKLS